VAAPGHPTTGILVETFAYAELTRLLAASDLGATLYSPTGIATGPRNHDQCSSGWGSRRANDPVVCECVTMCA
jgi:hypothetical protein